MDLEALNNIPMGQLSDEQWDILIANEEDPSEVHSLRENKRLFQLARRDPEMLGWNLQRTGPPLTEDEKRELCDLSHSTGADMSLV